MGESFEHKNMSFEAFASAEAQLIETAYEASKGTEKENSVLAVAQLFGLNTEHAV